MTDNSYRLEEVIRQYIELDPTTGTGWNPVLCKVCNDRGHKGKRAGFRFDGDNVAYHCFNCGHSTVYDHENHTSMPTKMIQVLNDFGIPEQEWQSVLFSSLANKNNNLSKQLPEKKNFEPQIVEVPKEFYYLNDAPTNDKWAEIAKNYLVEERNINPNDYPFMLCHTKVDGALKKWVGRIIIPVFKNDNIIFYTGRDLTAAKRKKYESPSVSRSNVIFGFDRLFDFDDRPLYIVEGWFDAFMINGVAIFGNQISEGQAFWLNRSRKRKVYIPDRQGNGIKAAEQALRHGWSISTPDIGDCKDINEAIKRYGKLYVLKSIVDNTATEFEAQMKLGVYCEK